MNPIAKHLLQIASCVVAVLAITALIYLVPFRDRTLSVALNLFLIVTLAASIRWGTRYALLLSVLSALGFSWALPPARHFHLNDGRVWTLLTACLVTGLVAGQLSVRARREAKAANQRHAEALAAQQRLRRLEADLAHINRISMMGELTASLAHELNQPIAAAITNANACLRWLTRAQPDMEEAREAATRMAKDGTRAAEIINRLRSFYKKGTPPQRELVDVNGVIQEITVLLRNEAARWSVSVHLELADGVPKVMGDRVQLQQVFMNLMLNAIEAMRETAGRLEIKSRLDQEGQLLISVSDTGVGLPHEKVDKIFDPFVTTKPQGTGMGLAITRSIIEAHGGRLWATGDPGRGATFQFTLPLSQAAQA